MESKHLLELSFTINNPNNSIELYINNEKISFVSNTANYKCNINLPNALYLEVKGKTDKDVIKDNDNNIVDDAHIKLVSITLDNIKPNELFLLKFPKIYANGKIGNLRHTNRIFYSNYFGFNGVVELDFDSKSVTEWYLRSNRFRNNDWHNNGTEF
jgi:hypothetical protein